MKKITTLFLFIFMGIFFSACQKSLKPAETIEVSNLTDEASKELLRQMFTDAEIPEARIEDFFGQVEKFNTGVSTKELTDGFETVSATETKYDPYVMQKEWMESNPDFEGYNCRITAFGLLSEGIKADENLKIRDDGILFMDYLSLDKDETALAGDSMAKFNALFASVNTTATKDVKKHVENLQKEWAVRKISFEKKEKAGMICVVFHDQPGENENILFIGHVGVLLEKDGELYFIEKVAFQEPYRLIRFENRTQLSDYLMGKYDVDVDQPTAAPFVMENDELMPL